jgi:hypothetical protein
MWLAGLLALALPLGLHLLSRGRAPRRRIGSVQLLAAAAVEQPRRLALRRPLLLLVRSLLLTAVALALAAPRLPGRAQPAASAPRPWLLVEPGLGTAVPPELRAAGATGGEEAELRWLAPGLPRWQRGQAVSPTALPDLAAVPGGVWSLLREAAASAPPGAELRVVTSGRLSTLAGERPILTRPLRWVVLPDEGANRWIARPIAAEEGAAAGVSPPGGRPTVVAALIGESDRQRSRFRVARLTGEETGVTRPVLTRDERGSGLRLPGGDAVPDDDRLALPSGPPRVRVALLGSTGRAADLRYVEAALRAAAGQAGLPLEVQRSLSAVAGVSLAFWLADEAPPRELTAALDPRGTLVLDRSLPEETCGGSFRVPGGGDAVALRRCAAPQPAGAAAPRLAAAAAPATAPVRARWQGADGRPVLVEEQGGPRRTLRLLGRFHPAWSDLVLTPALPGWLLAELAAAHPQPSSELAASDRRGDGGQGEPARATAPAPPPPASPSRVPEQALWATLPLLLIAERSLAGSKR